MLSQHPHLISRFIPVLLTILALFVYLITSAGVLAISDKGDGMSAQLAEPTRINGTVTDRATGQPLADIAVEAQDRWGKRVAATTTRSDGTYDIDVYAGTFQAEFSDPAGVYADFARKDIVVAANRTTQGVDAQLLTRGGITGAVTAAATGKPLPGIQVFLVDEGGWPYTETPITVTDALGGYTIRGLADDDYWLGFRDPQKRYQNSYYRTDASEKLSPIHVTAGSIVPKIDVALPEVGYIAGKVTAALSGLPLAGIQVMFSNLDYYAWTHGGSAVSTGDGTYLSSGLDAGAYHVSFADPRDLCAPQHYKGTLVWDDTNTSVPVTATQTTGGINGRLSTWGTIAGQVTTVNHGHPIRGIRVTLRRCYVYNHLMWWELNCDDGTTINTDADGRYAFGGLRPVDSGGYYEPFYYRVIFSDPRNVNCSFATDLMTVGFDQIVDDLDVAMGPCERVQGHIAGTATVRWTGAPAAGVDVTAFRYVEILESSRDTHWQPFASTTTNASGAYDVKGLYPGEYKVRFATADNRFSTEYFDDVADINTAKDVAVVAGMVVNDVDVDLIEHSRIIGRVIEQATGQPLAGYSVSLLQGAGYIRRVSTGADGRYDSGPLLPGNYTLTFSHDRFGTHTTTAIVSDEHDPARVDFAAIATKGQISGRVVDNASGNPLNYIYIECHPVNNLPKGSTTAQTAADGRYTTFYLDAGVYRLRFVDPQGRYTNEVYDQARSLDTGTDIIVVAGGTTTEINAALEARGRIAGRVTDEMNSSPLKDIEVRIYPSQNLIGAYRSVSTDAAGKYTTALLDAAAYRVQFVDPRGRYLTEVYDQAQSLTAGTDVVVRPGQTTADINAGLTGYPRLAGTVTDRETGAPLPNITIALWKLDGQAWVSVPGTVTRGDGTWTSAPLAQGTYRVGFVDAATRYRNGYYAGAASLANATDIVVNDTQVISGINAQLLRSGYFVGKVVDKKTGVPISPLWVTILRQSGSNWYARFTVQGDASGEYTTGSLSDGVYRLAFMDPIGRYWTQYYADAPDLAAATDITIGNDTTAVHIDAALAPVNHILGMVTDYATGKPLGGIEVMLWYLADEWQRLDFANTGPDGRYDLAALTPRTYRLGFTDTTDRYRVQFYQNADTVEAATDLPIAKDQTIAGIDVALVKVVEDATPTPTPTATVTPEVTPSSTPTATSTPSSPVEPWRVYLPAILR